MHARVPSEAMALSKLYRPDPVCYTRWSWIFGAVRRRGGSEPSVGVRIKRPLLTSPVSLIFPKMLDEGGRDTGIFTCRTWLAWKCPNHRSHIVEKSHGVGGQRLHPAIDAMLTYRSVSDLIPNKIGGALVQRFCVS